jgi:glycosyltransferase involved in cell wall biosynthesis
MKVLWHSNAPWAPTGYGAQTKLLTPRIAEQHEVQISSFYGLEGDRLNWHGIPVIPGQGNEYGNGHLIQNAQRFVGSGDPRECLTVTLMDVWVLDADECAQLDMACWVPIDHDPAPPLVVEFFKRSGAVPIAMSKWGQERLAEFGALYCPHAVDREVFKPQDQAAIRERAGIAKDAFLVGMVAANKGAPSRKCFAQALQAFAAFRQKHDDAILHLQTDMKGDENIAAIIDSLGIPDAAVMVGDQYRINFAPLSPELMAFLYSSFDVLLNPAAGEGFGVPIIEAQACGTPAIVTDFSAMQEVCGAGWKVDYQRRWTGQRAWQAEPDIDGIYSALEDCYALSDKDRKALSVKARNFTSRYDIDYVVPELMLPALEQARERHEERRPVSIPAMSAA